eukprot:9662059-Alexandrium_andersonii.AAC.1
MSASLVGSEMCIRDRLSTALKFRTLKWRERAPPPSHGEHPEAVGGALARAALALPVWQGLHLRGVGLRRRAREDSLPALEQSK